MSAFWQFTLSGMAVAWPPLILAFLVHHWRIRLYIDKRTASQTKDIRQMTDIQTADIRAITADQAAKLIRRRRGLGRSNKLQGD